MTRKESAMKKHFALILTLILMTATLCACGFGVSDGTDSIPAFSSFDLEGNEVDSSIFENADITVVNVWGTFCDPCKDEMPAMAEWDSELPDNVQIVGIVSDAYGTSSAEYRDAQKIVADSGVKFTNIIAAGELKEYMNKVRVFPTTLFVDKNGRFVHDPFVGADVGGYKDVVKSLTK
jgi:thiol-disulfide isomerase/thioredoxin